MHKLSTFSTSIIFNAKAPEKQNMMYTRDKTSSPIAHTLNFKVIQISKVKKKKYGLI